MAADYSVATERYETKPGLKRGSSSARGVVVQAQESVPQHHRWHKTDKRQLRNDFHLTAWDKTLVPHPTPRYTIAHKGKVSEAGEVAEYRGQRMRGDRQQKKKKTEY